jgi:hypothetical protein
MLALRFATDLGLHHLMVEGDYPALFTTLNQLGKCFSSFWCLGLLVEDINKYIE